MSMPKMWGGLRCLGLVDVQHSWVGKCLASTLELRPTDSGFQLSTSLRFSINSVTTTSGVTIFYDTIFK